jgi:glutaredoxin
MDYMTRLNAKNSFGLLNLKNDKNTWINVICGILLIVLIVLLIICLVKGKDSFGDTNKEDKILVFVRKGCPFVDRAKSKHKEDNDKIKGISIEYIDISHPLAKDHGITVTPTYVYLGNKVPGFHQNVDELYKKLTEGNNKDKDDNSGENVIKVYGRDSCPFCGKAKELLDRKGIKYKFVDSNSDEAKQAMIAHGANGVPLTVVLKKNGQKDVIHGFDEERLSKLK